MVERLTKASHTLYPSYRAYVCDGDLDVGWAVAVDGGRRGQIHVRVRTILRIEEGFYVDIPTLNRNANGKSKTSIIGWVRT